MPQPPSHIVVIGAGVTGLSSALELQSAGHRVAVLARDFPAPSALVDPGAQIGYASPWGGAHNRWVPPAGGAAAQHEARDHRLALATFRRMGRLGRSSPGAGITFLRGVEYLEAPGPEHEALAAGGGGPGSAGQLGIEGFRVLGRDELPDDRVRLGYEYDTWCVNPMVYCSFLLDRFVLRGGRVVRREVRGPDQVFGMDDLGFGPVEMVVNASGTGFGDPKSFIIRGMLSHLLPRRGHLIMGWSGPSELIIENNRANLPGRQPLQSHRDPSEFRRQLELLRPSELRRRDRHRGHQGA